MNRGSPGPVLVPACIADCFNEAPIHESGKCPRYRAVDAPDVKRFNEAPIHESGKCSGSGNLRYDRHELQ